MKIKEDLNIISSRKSVEAKAVEMLKLSDKEIVSMLEKRNENLVELGRRINPELRETFRNFFIRTGERKYSQIVKSERIRGKLLWIKNLRRTH